MIILEILGDAFNAYCIMSASKNINNKDAQQEVIAEGG